MSFEEVKLYKNSEDRDAFNRPKMGDVFVKTIPAFITILNQSNVNDVRYKDATHFALTPDKNVTTIHSLEINGAKYKVLLSFPSKRLTQLWLKELL